MNEQHTMLPAAPPVLTFPGGETKSRGLGELEEAAFKAYDTEAL